MGGMGLRGLAWVVALAAGTTALAGASAGVARASDPTAVQRPGTNEREREVAQAATRHPRERDELRALYPADGSAVDVWTTDDGRPTAIAREAVALIGDAAADGLRAADYAAAELAQAIAALTLAPDVDVETRARFDVALSLNLMRYWRDLHLGRVEPRAAGFLMRAPIDDHDFAAQLRAVAVSGDVRAATEALRPPLPLYGALRRVLPEYRRLAATPAPAIVAPPASIKPGGTFAGLPDVRRHLQTLGDLPPDAQPPADPVAYDGEIVTAVTRFQRRHGLEPDGVLGRGTLAALATPLADRVRQIEVALERLRWLPHLAPDGFLAVNIPMFRLWGWGEMPPDGQPAFDMRVVVGRARHTETPVLVEEMRHLIFRPYWNVPRSILRGEILPALARDAAYLEQNDMEVVAGDSDRSPVVPMGPEAVAGLREGRYRVRQRPGAGNALGLVKFVFPNDESIFMHDTPARALFARARRDFSHGCIRLERPVDLAAWVLRDQPEWTRERILAAMNGNVTVQVPLTRPLPVILFYLTAAVMPDDGTIHFAEDIYGHDARLARLLGY